jgi:hypothetical protein
MKRRMIVLWTGDPRSLRDYKMTCQSKISLPSLRVNHQKKLKSLKDIYPNFFGHFYLCIVSLIVRDCETLSLSSLNY